jgi:hypothetical protein
MTTETVIVLEKTIPGDADTYVDAIWRDIELARSILERTDGYVTGTVKRRARADDQLDQQE